jgi:Domain of unknown function (DUF2382)
MNGNSRRSQREVDAMNPPSLDGASHETAAAQQAETVDADADADRLVIPVIREEAHIQTVQEHVGTVRIRKHVHHTTQPLDSTGWHEVVETLRVPVNEVVERPEPPWQQDGATVIPVYEERLVRQLVLVEELHVQRRRIYEEGADIGLRHEELLVERLNPDTGQWVADPGGWSGS